MAREVTDLPLPDSPTSPTVWPGSHVEADVVDGDERLLTVSLEGDGEVAHRQQRLLVVAAALDVLEGLGHATTPLRT